MQQLDSAIVPNLLTYYIATFTSYNFLFSVIASSLALSQLAFTRLPLRSLLLSSRCTWPR